MKKQNWYSSYQANNYGGFFYLLIRLYQPKKVVELGTKDGYSAYHLARGLTKNGKGRLICYDLWERYPFHSVPLSVAQKNLKKFKAIIKFVQRDVIGVEKLYQSVDILHVDVSNDSQILEKIIPKWLDKVRQFIIIEGGSVERDEVEWMTKYKKGSIKKWLEVFSQRRGDVEYFTFEPFPSLTIIKRK
jgi:predicted O-methyltransferase YrrM